MTQEHTRADDVTRIDKTPPKPNEKPTHKPVDVATLDDSVASSGAAKEKGDGKTVAAGEGGG